MADQMFNWSGRSALITGANRGIGLELARQLKEAGAQVIAAHRGAHSGALEALGLEQITECDVTSSEVAARLRGGLEALGVAHLDLLINNAGLLHRDSLGEVDYDTLRSQFEVNTLGPLKVTEALLPYLTEGARVANISSRMGSIEDNTSGGFYGYRASKAALNAVTRSLAFDLSPRGVSVVTLHPGFVRTGMTGGNGLIDPPESARGLLARIEELSLARTGTFWHMDGAQLPW